MCLSLTGHLRPFELKYVIYVIFPPKFLCTAPQTSAVFLEQSMGAGNQVGIVLLYRPTRLHRLVGRYDNWVPLRFPAPIDCSKIPAL